MSLFNTLFQSERNDFVQRRLPIVFKARGNPLHFSTILLPISFFSSFNSRSSPFRACSSKTFQHSSSSNCFRRCTLDLMLEATFSIRVVTRILLPGAP
ncbi:hypothetical protein VIGAN_11015200 [Vigna angularis var. angularis]|uniref:Uncharacterized protein n=1 Tax=Vigna angularis var. angularis TaxID=157739 RepID=A0A0S3T733_PHAAN|nr:hypothetical protein VIGAN_11015200 [Vigna angularis var. angularis]